VLWRFFDRHGVTFKKDRARHGAAAPDVLKKRLEWFGDSSISTRQASLHRRNGRLDQFGAQSGRCRRGRRLRIGVPHGHYKTVTLVAAYAFAARSGEDLRSSDQRRLFEEWVENCLIPRFRKATSLSWTICPPTRAAVEEMIKARAPSCATSAL